MKQVIYDILNDYLKIYSAEQSRLTSFFNYLENSIDSEITDWNNFNGHIVSGGFIYSKKEKKFLMCFHKDLQMYLYPGGHVEESDDNPLTAGIRETIEETGLDDIKLISICENSLVPFDIDIQVIEENKRLNLPSHYHYDFRYFFVVDHISEVKLDLLEHSNYKWLTYEELKKECNYLNVFSKLESIIKTID